MQFALAFTDMFVKCHVPVTKGESARRALIAIKAKRDQATSELEVAKKKITELEAQVQRVEEESVKALQEAKLIEEANV